MDNVKLVVNREGHLHANGHPTGIWLEKLDSHSWRLNPIGNPLNEHAIFRKRKFAVQAANVFIEGATKKEGDSVRQTVIMALRSCAATGSTTIVKASK